MSEKLGFTFYPKDWWVSDTYFELTPIQRYIYLECLFVMYANDGYMKTQKTQMENRLRTQISDDDWDTVAEKFLEEGGYFTHVSVNKRLKKTLSNRENGKKGGAPTGNNNASKQPKQPKKTTQNNPPLEIEREREIEREKEIENKKNNIDDRKQKFAHTLEQFSSIYSREMLLEFYRYWTEPNKSGTKFRQELEKTWDLSRRLETWSRNDSKFQKEKGSAQKEKVSNQEMFQNAILKKYGQQGFN